MTQETIDGFAHVFPKEFYETMRTAHPTEEIDALADARRFWDMDIRKDHFETYGIDRQVVSLARPPVWRGLDSDEARPLIEEANDAVLRLADDHEELIPVATLPFVEDWATEELDRVLDAGMVGVQIFSNDRGGPIDSDDHWSLYSAVEDAGVPIWLHPQLHSWHQWDEEFMLHKILGWPFDTSLALARLVFSGVMEEHPDLVIIPHHMGAMIPHFVSRLDLFHEMLVQHPDVYPYEVKDLRGHIHAYFSRFYGDTARCGDNDLLETGMKFFGDDQLIFATDYPFGPDAGERFIAEEKAAVERMDIDSSTRDAVLGGNLATLL